MLQRQTLLALGMALTAIGLGACGDDGDKQATKAAPQTAGKTFLIKTRLHIPKGEVLAGSKIGDSAFCAGGTFRDEERPDDPTVVRTLRCPDGDLKITFTARHPAGTSGNIQSGAWVIQSGTGRFKELRGDGRMKVTFTSKDKGRETFTGTVVE